jgi:hypothetical protein
LSSFKLSVSVIEMIYIVIFCSCQFVRVSFIIHYNSQIATVFIFMMGDVGFLLLMLLHLHSLIPSFPSYSLSASLHLSFVDVDSTCFRRHRISVYATPRPRAILPPCIARLHFLSYMILRVLLFPSPKHADAILSDQKNNTCMRPMSLLNLKTITKQEYIVKRDCRSPDRRKVSMRCFLS